MNLGPTDANDRNDHTIGEVRCIFTDRQPRSKKAFSQRPEVLTYDVNKVIHLVTSRELTYGSHRVSTFKPTHLEALSDESASSVGVLYNTEHRRAAQRPSDAPNREPDDDDLWKVVLSSLLRSCLDRRGLFSSASRN